ncbi:hypothetical protein AOQ84DRAFT_196342 [Glonium stellatum]|uniref:Uncharacterized protein n=1 Tax=Glonium stellatum TaxID=574774 RepID=A0A8E2EP36_9PEZI|nr:hypothetical protein AOQ84DRAFT_196342 [Glonium stellatum]
MLLAYSLFYSLLRSPFTVAPTAVSTLPRRSAAAQANLRKSQMAKYSAHRIKVTTIIVLHALMSGFTRLLEIIFVKQLPQTLVQPEPTGASCLIRQQSPTGYRTLSSSASMDVSSFYII